MFMLMEVKEVIKMQKVVIGLILINGGLIILDIIIYLRIRKND